MATLRWHVHRDAQAALAEAAAQVLAAAQAAIAARGAFRLVLSGGETPRRLYALLAMAAGDWGHWHVYWGDERCVPRGDGQRNDAVAEGVWLAGSRIPRAQIHPIPAELGAEQGARAYSKTLDGVPGFDLALLGLGEDGHTASLFPGHDWGTQAGAPAALAVHDAPKPPRERVSLSAARLSRSNEALVLALGEAKRDALRRWRAGDPLPITAIRPAQRMTVCADAAAMAG
jgi:6-phosphogluconolactonase